MKRDNALNTGEYFVFGEKHNFLRFIFYSVYVHGYAHENLGDPGGQGIWSWDERQLGAAKHRNLTIVFFTSREYS